MNLSGKNITFRRNAQRSNPNRALILLGLLIAGAFVLRSLARGEIKSPFAPTPVPTRLPDSFVLEAKTHFYAGNLEKAIQAMMQATLVDPQNAQLYSEIAQMQVYSSALMTTDEQKRARLQEARESIDQALELAPDDSTVHAIRAFVLDWNADPNLTGEAAAGLLVEAEQEAVRALQINNQNTLALVYYAEILLDQQKYLQAEQYINQAIERDPTVMDVHRVSGILNETMGEYGTAIEEYKKAIKITPNLTFLYISIGVNYRQLKQYDIALEYFARAAAINDQIGVKDPLPYIAIGKTYSQMGEFFAASLNTRKALQIDPYNEDTYGSLGVIYYKARNYESAIPTLKCAVRGCTAEESCAVRLCDAITDPAIEIKALPLSGTSVVYYFTYGSVLAGMHRPNNNYCEEAMKVFQEVRRGFPEDVTIMEIVTAGERICQSFGYSK